MCYEQDALASAHVVDGLLHKLLALAVLKHSSTSKQKKQKKKLICYQSAGCLIKQQNFALLQKQERWCWNQTSLSCTLQTNQHLQNKQRKSLFTSHSILCVLLFCLSDECSRNGEPLQLPAAQRCAAVAREKRVHPLQNKQLRLQTAQEPHNRTTQSKTVQNHTTEQHNARSPTQNKIVCRSRTPPPCGSLSMNSSQFASRAASRTSLSEASK
jgi:hypothetical protein